MQPTAELFPFLVKKIQNVSGLVSKISSHATLRAFHLNFTFSTLGMISF